MISFRQCALCALLLAAAPCVMRAQQGVRTTDSGVIVDFQDADLRVVLSALAEAGKVNLVFGDLPDRRVTLRLREAIPASEVAALIRSLATGSGLRVEQDGPLLRVLAPTAPAPVAASGSDVRLHVYRLKHVRAATLAATLQSLFGGARPAAPTGLATPTLTERLQSQRLAILAGDSGPAAPADAGLRAELKGPVQVVPDEASNSLLVRALPADWALVQEAITALDLRPLQVMIEVLIAEVRQSRDLDVRVSGGAAKSPDVDTRTSGTLGGEEPSTAAFLLRLARGGTISADVALAALSTRGDVRVLSRPLLLAQNNLEARMLVGSQRPFVQVFRSLPTDNGVRDQVVQYRDVGTTLAILPTINPDGYVSLQVSQEVSSATNETQFGAPVISTREATTHLFVKDGQTAVLGGLVDRTQEKTRTGIPGLSSLPWIGGAFGSTRTATANSELFLFLTPHIIANDEDLERIRGAVERKTPADAVPANPPVLPRKP
ncbi:MAG: secretin N-terminal domain-containing protein [Gemmatimonadota bacterium]|nr:secretin N-terminal domain-containing protein [Gemmatimonadota bacterium]